MEINWLMDNFNAQIQRAINDAINDQVLTQLQASLRPLNEQTTQPKGNVWNERPERKSENAFRQNVRCSSRDEPLFDLNSDEGQEESH